MMYRHFQVDNVSANRLFVTYLRELWDNGWGFH